MLYQARFHQRGVRGRRQILKQGRFSTTMRITILTSCGIMGPDLVVRLHRSELAGAGRARCVAATRHELSAGRSWSHVWSAEGFQVISGRKAWRDNCWCTRRGKCSFVRPYLCLQLSVSLSTQRGEQLYKQGRP